MPAAGNTQSRLNQTVNALAGRRLTQITYYGLRQDPGDPSDWDHDDWHHPVMGLSFNVGASLYSLVWDNSFGEYGAELYNTAMDAHLVGIGMPDGPPAWEVTDHPRWAVLLADPVREASVVWAAPGWPPQEHPSSPPPFGSGSPQATHG